MKPIKKSEQILLVKTHKNLEEEQDIQPLVKDIPFDVATENDEIMENVKQSYIPVSYNPIISSIGNSGWQISDIWRDIRVDNFSD
jgi:hypothetical protein